MDCNKVNIKKGSKGDDVKELQKYLQYKGYYTSKNDGECGDITVEAIKKLQKEYGLVVDGVFGKISCSKSEINGRDLSSQDLTIDIRVWEDMMARYNAYVEKNKSEPRIAYLNVDTPYTYITNDKYKDILLRYSKWVSDKGSKPAFVYIQDPNKPKKAEPKQTTSSGDKTGIYYSSPHFTGSGCNKLGQCNGYFCGVHSPRQTNCKSGIELFTESKLAGWAGTTTYGTSHNGIETALWNVAQNTGFNINVEWKHFSDLGSTVTERFRALGRIIEKPNVDVIVHNLYRNQYGHYEVLKSINVNNKTVVVLNSLGSRCNSPAYCGYLETRSFNAMASYIAGISQKSICIITYTKK